MCAYRHLNPQVVAVDMSKVYNKNVCSKEEVWKTLNISKLFGWSWCRDRAEPYRHTAVVLYFDRNPKFTVNFRTEDGTSKASAAFSEAKQLITIEYLADTDYERFAPLEEFSVVSPIGKTRAREKIQSILSYQPGNYNLFMNNCRHHVEGVVQEILGKDIPDELFTQKMNETKSHDVAMVVAGASLGVLGIGVTVWTVNKLFKGDERKKQEFEQ